MKTTPEDRELLRSSLSRVDITDQLGALLCDFESLLRDSNELKRIRKAARKQIDNDNCCCRNGTTCALHLYDGTCTRVSLQAPGEVIVDIAVDTLSRARIARERAWIGVGSLGVHEHTAGADGHIRFMTCKGDAIEVVAAFDSKGRGTMTSAGIEEP